MLQRLSHGEERTFTLSGDRIRLGRGSDNDVVLSDVSVSRYHAEIRRERVLGLTKSLIAVRR